MSGSPTTRPQRSWGARGRSSHVSSRRAGSGSASGLARKFPSINAASARRLAVELAAEGAARVEAARVREEQRAAWIRPPADGQVWLDAPAVAALLSVSIQRVYQLLRAGRIPYTVHGGKHWIRRVDAEVIAAARAFHQRAQEARSRAADSARPQGSR